MTAEVQALTYASPKIYSRTGGLNEATNANADMIDDLLRLNFRGLENV